MTKVDKPAIGFTEEDIQWLHHPHDDALVIILSIADFSTQWVLVENESSTDIFYYPAF